MRLNSPMIGQNRVHRIVWFSFSREGHRPPTPVPEGRIDFGTKSFDLRAVWLEMGCVYLNTGNCYCIRHTQIPAICLVAADQCVLVVSQYNTTSHARRTEQGLQGPLFAHFICTRDFGAKYGYVRDTAAAAAATLNCCPFGKFSRDGKVFHSSRGNVQIDIVCQPWTAGPNRSAHAIRSAYLSGFHHHNYSYLLNGRRGKVQLADGRTKLVNGDLQLSGLHTLFAQPTYQVSIITTEHLLNS
ncbi:hypothetical protein J6590_013551 [Homalodisca vitripennis]|nr:hypothetical protein J6590_013551 [Homalodisca vitripennis]